MITTAQLKKYLRPIGVCIAVLAFLWFAIFGEQGLYQLHKSVKLKKELKEEIVKLQNKIEDLKEEKELLYNPSRLELVIRQELGYVKEGEVVFKGKISP